MSYRFLIIDVSATTRALIKRAILQAGFGGGQVHEADAGLEAIELLQNHPVDLILIDPRLPDMDGIELIGRILAEPDTRSIPVVVTAARFDPRRAELLRRRGVKACLRKPFTPATFREVVSLILEPTHV
jgi:two-component system chemotaxis response regulator CheY